LDKWRETMANRTEAERANSLDKMKKKWRETMANRTEAERQNSLDKFRETWANRKRETWANRSDEPNSLDKWRESLPSQLLQRTGKPAAKRTAGRIYTLNTRRNMEELLKIGEAVPPTSQSPERRAAEALGFMNSTGETTMQIKSSGGRTGQMVTRMCSKKWCGTLDGVPPLGVEEQQLYTDAAELDVQRFEMANERWSSANHDPGEGDQLVSAKKAPKKRKRSMSCATDHVIDVELETKFDAIFAPGGMIAVKDFNTLLSAAPIAFRPRDKVAILEKKGLEQTHCQRKECERVGLETPAGTCLIVRVIRGLHKRQK